MRRPRHLTAEEEALWDQVAKTADALRSRRVPKRPPKTVAAEEKPTPVPSAEAPARAPKRLAPMERRLLTRIGRGNAPIDSRVDLHGLTQREAHNRLVRFLGEAQLRGDRIVLVITGKGRPGGDLFEDERGVLRRSVPHWLAAPDLRGIVVGYQEAHVPHGGSGALYVQIRRRRPTPNSRGRTP